VIIDSKRCTVIHSVIVLGCKNQRQERHFLYFLNSNYLSQEQHLNQNETENKEDF
jgi:hypothetical protein